MPQARVVIDPGHGGTKKADGSSSNNAKGPKGLLEKTVTLQVGLKARDSLIRAGLSTLLTREADVNHGLSYRAGMAKKVRADAFVSVHFNGWDNPTVQRTETFVHGSSSSSSRRLARLIQHAVQAVTGYRDGGVKTMKLGVLNPAKHLKKTAACLVEISFISDPSDEARLKDSAYRAGLGKAIANGIQQYLTKPGKIAPPAAPVASARQTPVFEDATNLA